MCNICKWDSNIDVKVDLNKQILNNRRAIFTQNIICSMTSSIYMMLWVILRIWGGLIVDRSIIWRAAEIGVHTSPTADAFPWQFNRSNIMTNSNVYYILHLCQTWEYHLIPAGYILLCALTELYDIKLIYYPQY